MHERRAAERGATAPGDRFRVLPRYSFSGSPKVRSSPTVREKSATDS